MNSYRCDGCNKQFTHNAIKCIICSKHIWCSQQCKKNKRYRRNHSQNCGKTLIRTSTENILLEKNKSNMRLNPVLTNEILRQWNMPHQPYKLRTQKITINDIRSSYKTTQIKYHIIFDLLFMFYSDDYILINKIRSL